jgi:hypothetical protein
VSGSYARRIIWIIIVKNRLIVKRIKAIESRVLISSNSSPLHVVGLVCREMTLPYVKPPANVATTASELAIPRYAAGD